MSEWDQKDFQRVAKAHESLQNPDPRGPHMGQEDYIQNADLLRSQLMAQNVQRRKIQRATEEREKFIVDSAEELSKAVDYVEGLEKENARLKAELAKLQKKK